MKIYKSIVDERILHDFSKIQGRSLMNHVANSYDIETAISFASLFCPEIIEVDDCIFISEFYNGNIMELRELYKNTKDMFVNSWSLQSLVKECDVINSSGDYIEEFARQFSIFGNSELIRFSQAEIS